MTDPRTARLAAGRGDRRRHRAKRLVRRARMNGFPLGGGKVSGGRIKTIAQKGLRNLQ